jgi:competence protein ComEC
VAFACGLAIAMSAAARVTPGGRLRLSMFDVGQAEAMLLTLPSGRSLLVDAAGPPGRFDIGDRVLVPAIAARGVTRLDWFALTHADLDHIGGALTVVDDLRPSRVIEGVALALHPERNRVMQAAMSRGASIESLRTGGSLMLDGVLLDVLHPPDPEWERQSVRNDDSLVIDVRFGSVSILLMGDAGEPVEAAIAARLRAAPLRILKAGHHGSRTSTSALLLDAARPAAALISAGRGNFYGHPSPAVIARMRQRGIQMFRTDSDGQVDLTTDGRTVEVTTWSGRRWAVTAR